MRPPKIQVRKVKYNGDLWGSYDDSVLVRTPERYVLWQPRGTMVIRPFRRWQMRYDHLQFFFPGCGYAISADYGQNESLRHCYCDIILPWVPPTPNDTGVTFIDLELDLHAEPSGHYYVADEDEFCEACVTMQYPDAVRDRARADLNQLIAAALAWEHPFKQIPLNLPRADMHLLDINGREWRTALTVMGL